MVGRLVILAWWTFRIYFYFFLLWGGEGGVRGAGKGGGGVRLFIENPRRGGGSPGRVGVGGAGSVLAGNWGGLNIFFQGRNSHQVSASEGPRQGRPVSPQKGFKNVLGTRREGTFELRSQSPPTKVKFGKSGNDIFGVNKCLFWWNHL